MKKKLLVTILSVSLLAAGLMGCGNTKGGDQAESADVETEQENQEGQLESGHVALRIWVEEANIENLQKMIDSFEQKYAGQADFDITIEPSGDADTRKNVLGDIHNAADIFSMPDDQLYSLIAGGALSPVVNQDTVKNANLPDAVEAASYQSTLYAYPYTADNGYFLYYNKRRYPWSLIPAGIYIHFLAIQDLNLVSMRME